MPPTPQAALQPANEPYVAVVWAFLWRFAEEQLHEEPRWPCTIDEFEAALLAPQPPNEVLPSSSAAFIPSLDPVLRWCAECCRPGSGSNWPAWLSTFTNERMRSARECTLAEAWGVNRLTREGGFWNLHWKDRVSLSCVHHKSKLILRTAYTA